MLLILLQTVTTQLCLLKSVYDILKRARCCLNFCSRMTKSCNSSSFAFVFSFRRSDAVSSTRTSCSITWAGLLSSTILPWPMGGNYLCILPNSFYIKTTFRRPLFVQCDCYTLSLTFNKLQTSLCWSFTDWDKRGRDGRVDHQKKQVTNLR